MTTETDPPTDGPIYVRTDDGAGEDERRQAAAADSGKPATSERDGPTGIELDVAESTAVLSPTRIELLRAVAAASPESMRAAARLVDRDVKNVHRDLRELRTLGLVELQWEGNRRRPVVAFDVLEVTVPIREG